jgi:hypothetical protein
MVSLARSSNGSYRARKRIPDDVREDDSHLYGARHDATFSAPAATKPHEAKQLVSTRFVGSTGEDTSLTPLQARGPAGEWYDRFIAKYPVSDELNWQAIREQVLTMLGRTTTCAESAAGFGRCGRDCTACREGFHAVA